MADYFPLVSRAVAGLATNTGDIRRMLYERARTALLAQLRSSDPALSEEEITRERLSLEDAIRRVEADAAARQQAEGATASKASADTSADGAEPVTPSDAADADTANVPESGEQGGSASVAKPGSEALRGVLNEAEGLGGASSHAAKAARDNYNAMPDRDGPEDHSVDAPSGSAEKAAPGDDRVIGRAPPPPFSEEGGYRPVRSYSGAVKWVAAALILAMLASIGYWQRNAITALFNTPAKSVQTTRDATPPSTDKPKISDRVSSGQDQGPGTAPASDVAQKAILYDEDSNDPQGKRSVGSVVWKTETVSPGPGLAPELAIRGDIDVPERRIRMTMSIRRNADKALPASHTIELVFNVPSDFSEGGIANVPGLLMKASEQTRGTPLSGLAVKVTTGYFLIGLSSSDAELSRNLQLLKERPWFDVPMVYNSGKRAILGVEKGPGGERVFDDALRAWSQPKP